jgi:anaerobic selenocysteine-containing dehydrogenase
MSKLYRESGLRRPANAATMHPKTGRDQGLADGDRAIVTSPSGTFSVQVIIDPAVMPGVIEWRAGFSRRGALAPLPSPAGIRRA